MKTQTTLPSETVWGLLMVLVIVGLDVYRTAPPIGTSEEQAGHLLNHESALYFFDAQQMAKRILPDPSLQWSKFVLDKRTGCKLVGHGVWLAFGTISGDPEKVPTPANWSMLFVPEEPQPLFVRLGSRASGDMQAALRRAGYHGDAPAGAPVEK